MVKLFNAYFPARTLLLAVSEALLVTLAMVAAIYTRYGADSQLVLFYESGLLKVTVVALVCIICMHYYDLYDSLLLSSLREVVTRLFQVLGTTCVVLALLYAIYPSLALGLSAFLIGIVLVGILLVVWRKLFFVLTRTSRLAERVLLLGYGSLATSLASVIQSRPELGLRLLGYVGNLPEAEGSANGLPRLGQTHELTEVVQRVRASRILVTMNDRRGKLPVAELLALKTHGIRVEEGRDFYEMVTGKVPLDSLRISWLLFSSGFRVSPGLLLYKRITSAMVAGLLLLLSLPLMLLIALAIWLDSGGPVLFRQQRVGKDGKVFALYKFRSMHNRAGTGENFQPTQENDERLTRVGHWLRRVRVDELPQLYNILRGDMYFVGPRPFALEEEQEWAKRIPFYSQRWSVRPGATGWAQIQRGYCATQEDNTDKLAYDLFYIKNMSVGLDLLIILQTMKILLLGRGAR